MNRFYKDAATGPATGGDGFVVLLDGRPVRTPAKALMSAPTKALAEEIAAEWAAQGNAIKPETMPLTQLLTTAIDRADQRADITAQALHYLDSDLLCYRTAEPGNLAAEQKLVWDPWLGWFEKQFGVALHTTLALIRLDQPQKAHAAVEKYIAALDMHAFTGFQVAASLTGSIVLGLALVQGAISAEKAWRCALCEELFYERLHDLERHGLDPIEQKRRDGLLRDLAACSTYLKSASL